MVERRPVGFIDIDRTIYAKHNGYLLLPILHGLVSRGVLNPEIASEMSQLYHKGNPSEPHLNRNQRKIMFHMLCAKGLSGVLVEVAHEAAYEIVQAEQEGIYPYVSLLVSKGSETHDLFIASAQPQFSAGAVARHLGIGYVSTEYEVEDGRFTGRIKKEGITSDGKRALVEDVLLAVGREDSFFVGDSEGDVGAMLRVEHVFCVNPDEIVFEQMQRNKWTEIDPTSSRSAIVVGEVIAHRKLARGR